CSTSSDEFVARLRAGAGAYLRPHALKFTIPPRTPAAFKGSRRFRICLADRRRRQRAWRPRILVTEDLSDQGHPDDLGHLRRVRFESTVSARCNSRGIG